MGGRLIRIRGEKNFSAAGTSTEQQKKEKKKGEKRRKREKERRRSDSTGFKSPECPVSVVIYKMTDFFQNSISFLCDLFNFYRFLRYMYHQNY